MNTKRFLLMTVIATLALSACGSEASAKPLSAEEVLSSVNTVVALTSMAQPQIADPNINVPAAATLAPISTVAEVATADLIQPINTPTASSYTSATVCDSSGYLKDLTISDGTVLAPGTTFTKTWRIQNTGSCKWDKNYAISFSSGDDLSGATTSIDQFVSPNATGDISVELTAPDADGTYTGFWILTNGSGTAFGTYVYVRIIVSTDSSTSTPTPTATTELTATPTMIPTDSPTLEPTMTPTPESTTIPTEEPTATPES